MRDTAADRILAAARTQFLEIGFERCSMDGIAHAARVSKQTLYALYPTKVELFATVMREAAQTARESIRNVTVDGRSPEDILFDYVQGFFEGFLTPENRALYRANLVAARHFPDLAAEMHKHRLGGGAPLINYLNALARSRYLRSSQSAELTRQLGNIAVEGSRYLMGGEHPSAGDQRLLAERAIALFLDGYASGLSITDQLPREHAPPPLLPTGTGAALRLSPQRLHTLFESSAAEFVTKGSHGANLKQIVDDSGVSVTTIYRQFGDKLGLFRHAIKHHVTKVWDDTTPGPPHSVTLDGTIKGLARWTLDRHLRPESLALQRLLITEAEQFPDLARWAYNRFLDRPVRELHDRLRTFGAPIPDAVAERAFYTLATFGVRFIMTSEIPDRQTRDTLACDCAQLFLHGCRAA